jgi:ribose transport system ATP-binding protein
MTPDTPALSVEEISKSFGGVPVLHSVSLQVASGHLTALAGENGAGKSTLMKIISGQLKADSGAIFLFGNHLEQGDPRISRRAGVAIVPQELAPYPDLTIYENLFVGREIHSSIGFLNRNEMKKQAAAMLEVFGLDINPEIKMANLSVAVTQIVEIVKATSSGARLLLLDEPSSAIPEAEVEHLFEVIKKLREHGVAMIYTTHRMSEIQELADSVVVLRDGNSALDVTIEKANEDTIIRAMVGRDLEKLEFHSSVKNNQNRLVVKNLQLDKNSPLVNFEIKSGEILGLGGLIGAGRTEIAESIFGIRSIKSGEIFIYGEKLTKHNPKECINAGMAFVPEDRKGSGLILMRSVLENGSLPHLDTFSKLGWINSTLRKKSVEEATNSVRLKSRGLGQLVGTLSGGNQQKIVLARWLTNETKILILDEPTRGVDVGARGEIYSIIRSLADSGMAVLLISSDMPELIGLSDRVLVIRGGGIVSEMTREQLNAENAQVEIFRAASAQIMDDVQERVS